MLEAKGTARSGDGRSKRGRARGDRAAPGREADEAARGDFRVAELYVERRGQRSIVGNIYKGVVDNVLPGMEAAFVDIGLERNGFLHVDEIVLPGGEAAPRSGPRPRPSDRRADQAQAGGPRPGGQGPAEDQGRAPVDAALDRRPLPGLHAERRRRGRQPAAVRTPSATGSASSCRRSTRARRGVIVRTAAQGARKADFERDIEYLNKLHEVVQKRAKEVKAPDDGVPGGRPLDPRAARRPREGVRRRDHRRPKAAPPGHELLPAHRAGARRSSSSSTRTPSPCSRRWA